MRTVSNNKDRDFTWWAEKLERRVEVAKQKHQGQEQIKNCYVVTGAQKQLI